MERVDVRGEICPRPALIVRERLADLDGDETLVVRGDYPPAERNLRRMCNNHGFEVAAADDSPDGDADADEFALRVRPTGETAIAEE
ncbi:sulfurtransferase TusA family protein [Halosimplex sp. J119]